MLRLLVPGVRRLLVFHTKPGYNGGIEMKCFVCGSLCQTHYIMDGDKITHVQKVCPMNKCWKSYPTKIPEPI